MAMSNSNTRVRNLQEFLMSIPHSDTCDRKKREFIYSSWRDSCNDEKDAERETKWSDWIMWASKKYHKMADLLLDKPLECMVIEGKKKFDSTMKFVPEWRSHITVDNLLFLIIQTLRTRCVYLKIKVPFRVELHEDSVVTRQGGLVKVQFSRFKCECVIIVNGHCGDEMMEIVKERLSEFESKIETHLREKNEDYVFEKIILGSVKGGFVSEFKFDIIPNCSCRYEHLRTQVYSINKETLQGEYKPEPCHFHEQFPYN
jgi:hypothetical protein